MAGKGNLSDQKILEGATYWMKQDDGYKQTTARPTPGAMAAVLGRLREGHKSRHAHKPGDGWHYLLGPASIVFNGLYWFGEWPSSGGAILAHVEDICKATGLSFDTLYQAAYGEEGEETPEITAEDHAACARPATVADARAVLKDLEDINFHSFYGVLEDALEAKGILPADVRG